jgi:predicted nucleic acid-binding protein
VSSAPDGLLDTNVFLHSLANDSHTVECRDFLAALERGHSFALLEPMILHELSYALPRLMRHLTPQAVARYLLLILSWPGVRGEKDVMIDAVHRWHQTPGLGFTDAYLAALATQRGCPVYTKNVRDLAGQGVVVPDPLPTVSAP